jgi:ubiquinone/menaquinone biosynthesis C-methylase UbiE
MKSLSEVQLANIEFHRLLAPQYEQQPFFLEENRQRVRALLHELAQTTSGERLLDLGCGTGLVLDLAHDLFRDLDGIDITQEMLEMVKQRKNVTTQLAGGEELPFADASFDAVTAYSVLHHIEDLSKVFREIRRTLKPGGFFYADESPSQYYLDAICGLDPDTSMAELVRQQYERTTSDAGEYEKRYGIPTGLAKRAMTQNFARHALEQENVERLLRDAGFDQVQITFRRFLGEDQCRLTGGEELANKVRDFLVGTLPLSRHFFKYFVLVAR